MNFCIFQAFVAIAFFCSCFPWLEAGEDAVVGTNAILEKIKETLKIDGVEWEDNPLRWVLEGAVLHYATVSARKIADAKAIAASITLGGNGHNTLISLFIEAAGGRKIRLFVARETTRADLEERFKDVVDTVEKENLIQKEIKKTDNPLHKHCKLLLEILISMPGVSYYQQPAAKDEDFDFTAIFGNTDDIDFAYDGYCGTGPSGRISKKAKGHLDALKYLERNQVEILDVDVKSFLTAYLTPGHEDKGRITTPKQSIAINYFKGKEANELMKEVTQSLGMPQPVFHAIKDLAKVEANHINLKYSGYMSSYDETKMGKITIALVSNKDNLVQLLTKHIEYAPLPAFG